MQTHSRIHSRWLVAAPVCLAVLLAGCAPRTDRESYRSGESGTARFVNGLAVPVYLAGCSHLDYQKLVGGKWVSQGPDIQCVWEGFAQPVAPGEVVVDPIVAREPGTWRLRYDVGVGCSERQPLRSEHCQAFGTLSSNEFEVTAALSASRCVVAGCSGELCVDESLGDIATICVWLPEYACLREARCGPFGPGGSCDWERTPKLEACLETAGG